MPNLPRFTFALCRVVRKGCAQTSAQGIMENSHAHNGEDHRLTTDDRQECKSIGGCTHIHNITSNYLKQNRWFWKTWRTTPRIWRPMPKSRTCRGFSKTAWLASKMSIAPSVESWYDCRCHATLTNPLTGYGGLLTQFVNWSCLCVGNIQRVWKELDPKAVCRPGCGPWHHQTVLPRWRQRSQEDLPWEVARAAIAALRSVSLYSNHRYAHQNVRHHSNESR